MLACFSPPRRPHASCREHELRSPLLPGHSSGAYIFRPKQSSPVARAIQEGLVGAEVRRTRCLPASLPRCLHCVHAGMQGARGQDTASPVPCFLRHQVVVTEEVLELRQTWGIGALQNEIPGRCSAAFFSSSYIALRHFWRWCGRRSGALPA